MNELVGAWKLVSVEYRRPSGEISLPFGSEPRGLLSYHDDGRMQVQVYHQERAPWKEADFLNGTDEELRAAFESMAAYIGTYTIDAESKTVLHLVEQCSLPNWAGLTQQRFFELSCNRLTLRSPPLIYGGETTTAVLVWERLG